MLKVNCDSTPPISPSPSLLSSRHSSFQGCSWSNGHISKDHGGVLEMAPKPSYTLTADVELGKILPDQSSIWSESEMTPCSSSFSSIASNGTLNSKSSVELVKEITSLEMEILHLERYLLTLYRTAFKQHVHSMHIEFPSEHKITSVADQSRFIVKSDARLSGHRGELFPLREGVTGLNHHSGSAVPDPSSRRERKTARCSHRSLGDHLGTPTENTLLDGPDILSEDIIRCISSIYCKLGDKNQSQIGPSVSSTSSLSSSGTYCTTNLSDTWSPYCNEEATWDSKFESSKEERGPYAEMIEVLKIGVDDDGFNYASRMLKKFRTLVKRLENVDPRKMKREQKLAFWINIHNALVMHAYLAYGTHNNTKSNSILKATYNIGGHSINAYIIQISIFGIKSHFRAPVRIYNAKNVFQDLRLAKEEFIQSTVYVNKETRIYLPKILYYFAKDMALTITGLLEIVIACLSERQRKAVETSIKGKPDKYVYWLSQSSIFRYVIHREGRPSV
ncbi:uncharacterized protein LOC112524483 isoform X3 [Cynara cardunculus var. scolymus]|uniref:uncharacterized protein LOC112524483 isoform X3 n=1 Tax=Cynara cardunculus var. scolymus TaxID=59895 RepID=UPI000D62686E|nr:uncharacterized protein LOC112524483 isoform X3 [Cynara cardunculus var. scolymus]